MDAQRRRQAYDRFDRATAVPMLALAALLIPMVAVPWAMELPDGVERWLAALDLAIWTAFGVELAVKAYLAPDRRRHLRHHWLDALMVAVPFLRPLRLLRSARALRLLRAMHSATEMNERRHLRR
ncbi:MAG TPA: hypothetical protein VIO14_01810 [Dehalococcoidia bacterium]